MGKLTYSRFGGIGSLAATPAKQLALALAFGASAFSQSAANFNTKAVAPAEVPAKKAKAAAPAATVDKKTPPANIVPSRYVEAADIDAYVQSLGSVLSMRGRATDPFGQLQDPDSKPVIKTSVAKKTGRIAPVQAVPLSDYLQRVKVTAIIAAEKRFLVGTRSFKLGGRMSIYFRNKTTELEVTSVTSRQIDFRCVETGEKASLKMNLLPIGMTPGTHGITAPGMVADRADAPINLDEVSPSAEN